MKNTTIVIIIVILLVLGFGFYFVAQQNKDSNSMMQKDPSKSSGQETIEKKDAMVDKSSSSRYVEYSKAVLDQDTDKRRVLFFYASWCPICRPADASFRENANKIPEDIVVIRVNYNDPETDAEEKALATKYGVTYQHTYVQIDANGNAVTKWNGGQIEELVANVK